MQHPDLFFARNGQCDHYRPPLSYASTFGIFEDAALVRDPYVILVDAPRDRFLVDVILHQLCRRLVRGDSNTGRDRFL